MRTANPCPSVAADRTQDVITRILALGNFKWHEHPYDYEFWSAEFATLWDDSVISEKARTALLAFVADDAAVAA